ncbi:SIMPL domain-containing protein [Candidatus Acetothermia bacterium]|nr:SIMPL domain-containing protein [Candidatus Acetothermia bacterium]MBI3643510.1 SIMPL domain-containing protein [Candidatus Acetothermia bacterium]
MKKLVPVAAASLGILLIFVLGTQFPGLVSAQSTDMGSTVLSNPRTISVSGTGVAAAKPDQLNAEIGVISVQSSLDEAMAEANGKMAAVIAALRGLGIEDKDIQTSNFTISIERPNYPGPITGYQVSNTLHVTIRDLSVAGNAMDQAVKAGANDVYRVAFAVSDTAMLATQARQSAVADAMSTAREIASAAGVQLGRVLTITTYDSQASNSFDQRLVYDASSSSVPVQPGELNFNANVQVIVEIK